jgi:hypothetical protein
MQFAVDVAAPQLEAEAFVRGEGRRTVALAAFRGSWTVVALGASHADVLELARLEEAFAADGAVVLAATPAAAGVVEVRYTDEPVRFPILCSVVEERALTVVVDPDGIVRYVGERQSARETLAVLEDLLFAPYDLSLAA